MVDNDSCVIGYGIVEDLRGVEITDAIRQAWPCELRIFWLDILPFVELVKWLLHHGTILIVMFGLLFNILSFFILTRKNMRKASCNMYLSILAIYDSLSLTLNFMVGVLRGQNVDINQAFQYSEGLCKFHSVLVEVFNLLSVWMIVAFTTERFVMIKFPLKSKSMTPKRTLIIIITVSVTVFIYSLQKIFVSGFEGDSVFGYKACKTRRAIFPEIIYFYVAFNTWFPTIIILILNMIIIFEIRKNHNRRQAMTNNTAMSKSDEKATKLLLVVSSTYIILVVPLGLVQTSELIWNSVAKVGPDSVSYVPFMITKFKLKWARAFFFFFYQFNNAINFFLYVFASSYTKFRANLRNLLRLKAVANETMSDTEMSNVNAVAPAGGSYS